MQIKNIQPGKLILPNGTEVATGETVDLPADFAENKGVADWVAEGRAELIKPKK